MTGDCGPAGQFGVVLLGDKSIGLPVSAGCYAYINPAVFFILPFAFVPPAFSVPIGGPNKPALLGLVLVAQAWWFQSAPNVPLALSPGVVLGIGM